MEDVGARIVDYYKPYGKVRVRRRYRTVVAFDEREALGDGTDMPVEVLLMMILYHVEIVVVPELVQLIENP
jgi:hypothetical protein